MLSDSDIATCNSIHPEHSPCLNVLQLPRQFFQPLPKLIADVGMFQAEEHTGLDEVKLVSDVVPDAVDPVAVGVPGAGSGVRR